TASQERSFVYERKERHTAPPLAPGMSWIRREGAVSASAGDPVARAMPSECSRLPTPRPATDDSVTPGIPPPIVRRDLAIAKGWREYATGIPRGDKLGWSVLATGDVRASAACQPGGVSGAGRRPRSLTRKTH